MKHFHKRTLILASVFIALWLGIFFVGRSELNLFSHETGQTSAASMAGDLPATPRLARSVAQEKVLESYGKLPLVFEPNFGDRKSVV